MHPPDSDLIYDWNRAGGAAAARCAGRVELDDETLRDGLQSPVRHEPLDRGEDPDPAPDGRPSASTRPTSGCPAPGPHVVETSTRLAQEIVDAASCKIRAQLRRAHRARPTSCRSSRSRRRSGSRSRSSCFIGSSPIRQYAEDWDFDRMLRLSRGRRVLRGARGPAGDVRHRGHDARAPGHVAPLYTTAIEAGARRVCVCDTVGHATPDGARNLVALRAARWSTTVEPEVKVDWHGHRDRGLGVINALPAARGRRRPRARHCALGIGERVGNTPMDLLLVNLQLLGWIDRDLDAPAASTARLVSEATGVPIPDNYPVVGRDAFRTGTGVHAAAIIKARKKGDDWLADRVYSGVPASHGRPPPGDRGRADERPVQRRSTGSRSTASSRGRSSWRRSSAPPRRATTSSKTPRSWRSCSG